MRTLQKVWRCCSFPVTCRATFTTSSLRKSTMPTKPSANSLFAISENLSALSSSRESRNQLLHHDNAATRGTNGFSVNKEIPRNLLNRKFITLFTRAHNLSILNYSPRQNLRPRAIFLDVVVSVSPNRQAGGPPLVAYPQPLNQFILSFTPYFGAVSSIHNLTKR